MATTPNMSLVEPTEGGSSGVWDVLLDAIFSLVDAHDHTTGKGVAVPVAGLNMNANLSLAGFGLTSAGRIAFSEVAALVSGSTVLFVSSVDHELYWRTAGGTNVKVTASNALNVAAFVGGIGGDYTAISALLSYDDASHSYWAQQEAIIGVRKWAGLRVGVVDIYDTPAATVNRVRLASPAALAASYAITFPAAVPASTVLVQMSSTGVLTATNTIPVNTDIVLSGTGKVQHASYSTTHNISGVGWIITAGGISVSTTVPGAIVAASTTAYYPIAGIGATEKFEGLTVYSDAASVNSTTYSVVQTDVTAAVPSAGFTADIAGTPITSTAGTVVITPTTAFVPGNGRSLWLKVVTAAATTRTLLTHVRGASQP